jgi:hypothetical protein
MSDFSDETWLVLTVESRVTADSFSNHSDKTQIIWREI